MHSIRCCLFTVTLFTLLISTAFSAVSAADSPPSPAVAEPKPFKEVSLDSFIVENKVEQKIIKMAEPITFEARMKRYPEKKAMSYVYEALQVAGVQPMPVIEHRMFIESKDGRIIPVYVEKNTVNKLKAGLKEEEFAHFVGYHVYSYAKGPAILVVDYTP